MTDRLKGFTVSLDQDTREDDAEHIINAIKMIRGIGNVTPLIVTPGDWLARARVKSKIREKVLKLYEGIGD